MSKGVMHRRQAGEAEDKRKRTPPVRLGRRILAHLRRWARLDAAQCSTMQQSAAQCSKVDYVCHYDGRPIAKLRRSWPQAVKAAELTGKVTPHCLRHTRATWLMQAGIDIWEAAGSLGMTPETLSKTYGHHHPDYQRKASEV